MAERALEIGREQIDQARSTGRTLSERALRMHCAAYLATAKARLLTAVILDMKASKGSLATGFSAKAEALNRAEERLRAETAARERLQAQVIQSERMRAAGALASGVAHDLKNFLFVIGAGLEKASASVTDADVKSALDDAQDATRAASSLAATLLDLERPKTPVRSTADLNELVRKCVQLLQPALPTHIELRATLDPSRPTASLDVDQWLQALLNLGINAKDALADNKGAISFATGLARIQQLPPAAPEEARAGDFAWVRVSDSGSGMSTEVMARVFEPFFTTKEHGKGTGLGLTLVYGCARAHGGWVEVTSKEGAGTTFQLFVPAVPTKPAAPPTGGPPDASPAGPPDASPDAPPDAGAVLVVDDLDLGRRASARIIERLGYRAVAASSGEEALAAAQSLGPALVAVLTDLRMPSGDGQWLLDALRARGLDVPVIVCSGSFDRSEVVPAGFDGLLSKPFAIQDARRVFEEVLAQRAPRPAR